MQIMETVSHLLRSMNYSGVDTRDMVLTIALPKRPLEDLGSAINRELSGFVRDGKPVNILEIDDFKWYGVSVEFVERQDI